MKAAIYTLRSYWRNLLVGESMRQNAATLDPIAEKLLARYTDPHRAYHNADHLLECLTELDTWRHLAIDSTLVAFALWFHDAIYDPHRHDNEQLSADLAGELLGEAGLPQSDIEVIQTLILDTSHQSEPVSPDGRLIADIDLAILGKNADRFDNYDRAIRLEYAHVPDEAYRIGRLAVLERFLSRPIIYRTPAIAERYEGPARVNLRRAIGRLRGVQ